MLEAYMELPKAPDYVSLRQKNFYIQTKMLMRRFKDLLLDIVKEINLIKCIDQDG